MNDNEFDAFLDLCNFELGRKQAVLMTKYGIRNNGRWSFDQETGKLQFFDSAKNLKVESDVINIGSYSIVPKTWKWAWSNDSVLTWLRQKAEKLKELESITGMDLFVDDNEFKLNDQSMAWELAAMCVKHLGAIGCYRAPSFNRGGPVSFLAIMSIQKVGENDS